MSAFWPPWWGRSIASTGSPSWRTPCRRDGPRSSERRSTSSDAPTDGWRSPKRSSTLFPGGLDGCPGSSNQTLTEARMAEPLLFSGVMPANLLPFRADLSVDEVAYRRHLRWLADTPGVTAIVANGHAAEVSSLSREERVRTLVIALDEVGGRCPVVAGVYADGTAEAVSLARDAKAAGAAGVLVFPPTLFIWGA